MAKLNHEYIETNLLDKGVGYLPETQSMFAEQEAYAKELICDLKNCISETMIIY